MSTLYRFDKDETSSSVVKGSEDGHFNMTTTTQQIVGGGGDQEMISLTKSLETGDEMSGAMQKLHSLETEKAEMSAALQTLEAKVLQGNSLCAELAEAVRKLTVRVEEVEKTHAGASAESAREEDLQQEDLQQEDVQQEELQQEDSLRRVEKDDDDIDLFGDDGGERSAPTAAVQMKPVVAKRPAVVAKSTILLDVKPWDDETDMAEVERCVRSVQADGLLWGASKLVEVGYGIKKLQINCVVEDDKVGTDMLEDEITKFEDFVQSVDIFSFNKI